jgi:Transglutaminase-like superfamily
MKRLLSRDGLLLVESAVLLALVRLALLLLPFRTSLYVVNLATGRVERAQPPSVLDSEQVKWAVLRAGRVVPGGRHCLTRALAAKVLFSMRGRTADLRIGVAKNHAGHLTAHAWLESDGAPIFGLSDAELGEYTLLPQLDRV